MFINDTHFGAITIDGQTYDHDVVIRMTEVIEARRKKLSKKYYGTSHRLSREEAEFLWEVGCPLLILGTGQYDSLALSEEAAAFFAERQCVILARPTPEAVRLFNATAAPKAAMFHVTC